MRESRIYKAEGVVIRRKNIGEADRLLTVFCRRQGKIRIAAKGVRKLTSRRKGHIEVFNRVAITIHKGKTMDILTEADTVSGWVGRPVKFGLIGYAYYVCEIVDALLPESDPHEELYNRFVRVLRTVLDSENPDSCREAVNGFSVHLLRSLGYLPHTDDLPEDQIVPRIESVIERRLKTPKIGLRMNR